MYGRSVPRGGKSWLEKETSFCIHGPGRIAYYCSVLPKTEHVAIWTEFYEPRGERNMVFHLGRELPQDCITTCNVEDRVLTARVSVLSPPFQASSTSTLCLLPTPECKVF